MPINLGGAFVGNDLHLTIEGATGDIEGRSGSYQVDDVDCTRQGIGHHLVEMASQPTFIVGQVQIQTSVDSDVGEYTATHEIAVNGINVRTWNGATPVDVDFDVSIRW